MGILSSIKKQFIDVIHSVEEDDEILAKRYDMQDFEIQNGASLTVRESQAAIFVNEGQLADVFGAGTYKLTTQTLPVLTALKNWDKLFESPFKSDVYFVSTRLQMGRKWGTAQPVTLRDKDFGMVRIRAFGMYSYRVADAGKFHTQVSGTKSVYTRTDLEQQLRNLVVSSMTSAMGKAGVAFLDMAADQPAMAEKIAAELRPQFEKYGLELDAFAIENLSLPEDVQQAIDKRSSMSALGDVNTYTRFQAADAIPILAANESGMGAMGAQTAQMAIGLQLGQVMGNAMTGALQPQVPAATPAEAAPAAPAGGDDPEARLAKLKALKDKGLITEAQFAEAQAEILKKLIG
jgi:membrane protease subunit (stomatin/prohibitin family)